MISSYKEGQPPVLIVNNAANSGAEAVTRGKASFSSLSAWLSLEQVCQALEIASKRGDVAADAPPNG
jgi:hypothetical protein